MTPPNQDSAGLLCAEILADAQRTADEILQRARDEAASVVAKADADAEAARKTQLDQARTEAARRSEMILATVPVETGRIRSVRINDLLETIREEIRQRLLAREGFDYRATIIAMVAGAIRRMAGDSFVVRLSVADRQQLGDSIAAAITAQVGRTPIILEFRDDDSIQAGVVIQDNDGRQVWDNRLASRLDRMWPALQRQIAAHTGLVTGGVA